MRAAAIALVAVTGCDFVFRLDPVASDARSDGARDGADGPPSWTCELPQLQSDLPGFSSSDYDPSQNRDKTTLYFARNDSTFDIYVASRASTAEPYANILRVAELSSAFTDVDPAILPSELHVFFTSDRLTPGTRQLFEARRDAVTNGFRPPTVVDTSVTVEGIDVSSDGLTLYANTSAQQLFTMSRADLDSAFASLVVVGSGTFPSVAGDELSLYYDRSSEIYRMTRKSKTEPFGNEVAVTNGGDADISEDGRTLVFRTGAGFAMMECP